ncbi:MAG TPA: APC family permease [Flavisolibacter sp.]|nr:APC family permease [Flavisolibacter sp.]
MATPPSNKLKKVLGLAFGIAVILGGTIGVGILRTPASIAAILPDATLILLCWLVAGLYVVLAASSYAELTTMLPKAGGAYNYIKRAFGGYAGFLNGWFDFITNAIAPAYFCIVLSEYSALLFPQLKPYGTLTAIFFVTVFTLFNLPGVKSGSTIQQLTSAAKVLLFLALVTGCFFSNPVEDTTVVENQVIQGGIFIALFKSLQLIMGSYDGWMAVSFFAEEDDNPEKNIPRSYLVGTLSVTILYVLINAAILYVLPVEKVAASPLAAADAAAVAFGGWSTNLITIIALFSLFSILNAYMMIPSRILFGLSRDGFFLQQGAVVNKGGTPYFSLLFCYVLTVVLILVSSFDQLFALGAFLMTIVTGFAFLSLIWLRKKEPELKRPFKAWGYPFSTYFALLVTISLFVGFAISDKASLLIAGIVAVCSYPCYRLLVTKDRSGK